ncbi:MAG: peptidylprolyl isomerase [Micropruina sp.]|uniref:peptidylprolyl isomerase n=1 Tax=Micropruina sp. TaxID=2737536 RepID=UPI0039E3F8F2
MIRPAPMIVCGALLFAGCSTGTAPTAPASPEPGTASCSYPASGTPDKPVNPPPTTASTVGTATITLTMTGGTVTITGDRARTPCTLNSMESLAKQGFFDDTGCHRLGDASSLAMVQCGDPTGTGSGGPGYRFDDEIDGAGYPAGTVAMANSGAGTNTNGSQFFIVFEDVPLNPDYTVFGRIDEASLKVIKAMAAEGHDGRYGDGTGVPKNAFRIIKASVA